MKTKLYLYCFVIIIVLQISGYSLYAQTDKVKNSYENIYEKIESLYREADILWLSFILVDEKTLI